ncbi:MAG TPA: hypothetical protein VF401_00470 [Candidatus Saccharimonadales bacterium]
MATVQHQQVTGWTGWVGFAGIVMAVSGVLHILFGIGGVVGQDWYITTSSNAWVFDASSWGWSMIAGGILLAMSASLLLTGHMLGRIIGAILVTASLLVNIALFAAAPLWSAIAIFIDLMILYAIVAHGGEMAQ